MMELMKKTVDDPYLGKMQVKKVSSPYTAKRKVKLKFPWKKNVNQYDYETSEELDAFIQEVIDKARAEYLREYEEAQTREEIDRVLETDKLQTDDNDRQITTHHICNQKKTTNASCNQNQRQSSKITISDDDCDKVKHSNEKKPLLSAKQSQQSELETTAVRAMFRRMLVYVTCCYCHCFRDSCDLT